MKKSTALWAGGTVLALLVGVGIGAADNTKPETVTETKTVTQEKTVEKTPQACLDALDASERLVSESVIPYVDASMDLMDAALAWDADGISEFADTVNGLTEHMSPIIDEYNTAATECRAAS